MDKKILDLAKEQNAVEFEKELKKELNAKVLDKIEQLKKEMFKNPQPKEEE